MPGRERPAGPVVMGSRGLRGCAVQTQLPRGERAAVWPQEAADMCAGLCVWLQLPAVTAEDTWAPSHQGEEQGVSCSASCCPGSLPCPGDSQSGMEGPEAAQPGTDTVCPRPAKDTHQLDRSAGKESALPRRVASSISQTGRVGQGSPSSFHTNTDSAPHLPSALHPPG